MSYYTSAAVSLCVCVSPAGQVAGVFSVALDGLVAIAKRNADSSSRMVEALRTFYLEEFVAEVKKSGFSRVMNHVQRLLVQGIARILLHEREQHGLPAVKCVASSFPPSAFLSVPLRGPTNIALI